MKGTFTSFSPYTKIISQQKINVNVKILFSFMKLLHFKIFYDRMKADKKEIMKWIKDI